MAEDGGVVVVVGELHGGEGFSQGTDLVDLDEDGIGGGAVDAALEEFYVSDKEIVTDELHIVTDFVSEFFPTGPVVFVAAILNADDGIFFDELGVEIDHLVRSLFSAIAFLEDVALLFAVVKFTAGHIEREVDVFPSLVSGGFDGGENTF